MATPDREALIGRSLEAFVAWARVLASHRTFPFGDHELTRAQVEALFLVAHAGEPTSPGRLAEAMAVTPGAVTQLVAGLIDADLVTQERDEADGRRRVLVLSASARRQVEGFERDMVRRVEARFEALDDDELATLVALLDRTRRP